MFAQSPGARWSVEIYEVTDHDHQQRILEIFLEIARPHLIALGTQSGHRWFVIVEVASGVDRNLVRRTICAIDPRAVRTYSSKQPRIPGPMLA